MKPDNVTLRDWLAMNAPLLPVSIRDQHDSILADDAIQRRMTFDIELRYNYADIALKIREEGMPKPAIDHPSWARWAARDSNSYCYYYPGKPSIYENETKDVSGWGTDNTLDQIATVAGDTSWIPADWKNSLTPVNQ